MSSTHNIKTLVLSAAIATFTTASAELQKREIRLENAPEAVQAAIRVHSRGGTLDEIKRIQVQGKTIFTVEVDLPGGRDLDLYFEENGALTKSVEEIILSDAPEPVRAAVLSVIPANGKLDDIDLVSSGGSITYRVEIDRPGPDLHLIISTSGEILDRQDEADD